jgi:Fe-S-cluster-containing hydrogenase component 2
MGNIKPIDISFFTAFNEDLCNGCGECFHNCPVMHLPLDVAVEEMKKLIAGEKTKKVLNKFKYFQAQEI